jgi:hypothetical protein
VFFYSKFIVLLTRQNAHMKLPFKQIMDYYKI